jgi:heme/copper-type cytochrome/quinol oxidase subunit 3
MHTSTEATTPLEVRRVARARAARPNGWWGMAVLVATEVTLFGTFIASWFYLRLGADSWPPRGTPEPEWVVPLLLTALLVSTSVPMQIASSAAANGRLRAARLGLLAALALGAAYLAIQLVLFVAELHDHPPDENAYASLRVTLEAAHHAHVAAGLLLNAWLLLRLARGLTAYRQVGVQAAALYWHVVNLLALAVTATLLSPAL